MIVDEAAIILSCFRRNLKPKGTYVKYTLLPGGGPFRLEEGRHNKKNGYILRSSYSPLHC